MVPSIERCPTEIWHEIFAFVCTDTGLNGRSISLVSKRFHDLLGPLKYQPIAIARWRQLIAFSQTFSQLPDNQKRIKYLFIHCPYPFLDVEDSPRLPSLEDEDLYTDLEDSDLDYCTPSESDSDSEVEDSPSLSSLGDFSTDEEDSDSDVDYTSSESDSDSSSDSEFDESMDSDEEHESLEDSKYLQAIRNGLPQEGDTRDDRSEVLDYEIQAVFDKATNALHAILKETSSTLNILTLYWTSFRPLQIPAILSGLVLPFLDELHLYRCSVLRDRRLHIDSSTTPLLPRLRLLVVSGDGYSEPLEPDIATIAPNLTHLRFTPAKFDNNIQHNIWYWSPWANDSLSEDAIAEMSSERASEKLQALLNGNFDGLEFSSPVMRHIGVWPEHWQMLWSSRVAGLTDVWSVK